MGPKPSCVSGVVLAASLWLVPRPAMADLPEVVVYDLQASSPAKEGDLADAVQAVSAQLTRAIRDEVGALQGYRVTNARVVTDWRRQADLHPDIDCSTEARCAIALGASIGAAKVISGRVSRAASIWTVTLELVELSDGLRLDRRLTDTCRCSLETLAERTRSAARQLLTTTAIRATPTESSRELPQRVAVIVSEKWDGQPGGVGVDTAVTKALLGAGYQLASPDHLAQVKEMIDLDLLEHGRVPSGLSALVGEVDIIVAGTANVRRLGSVAEGLSFIPNSVGSQLVHSEAIVQLRAISVDTGQILAVVDADGKSTGLPGRAETEAVRKAADALMPELLAELARLVRPSQITLTISGVPDHRAAKGLEDALATLSGITSVRVRNSSKRETRIDLRVADVEGFELASRVDRARIPLEIVRVGARSLLARYDATRTLEVEFVMTAPRNRTRVKRLANEIRNLGDVVRTELRNLHFLTVDDSSAPPPKVPRRIGKAVCRRLKEKQKADLFAALDVSGNSRRVTVTLEIWAAKACRVVLAEQLQGPPHEASSLAARVAGRVRERLLDELIAQRDQLGLGNFDRPAAGGLAQLVVTGLRFDAIFPARLGHYRTAPVGMLTLRYDGDAPLSDIVVKTMLPPYVAVPQERRLGDWPGMTGTGTATRQLEVPIYLTLDPAALRDVEETRPAQAQVEVAYRSRDGAAKVALLKPVLVRGKNAMDWSEPDSVAAFVSPHDPSLLSFVGAVAALQEASSLPPQLVLPSLLAEAVGTLGIRYVKDPVDPSRDVLLDFVQAPGETIARRRGDCDDSSVLLASVWEAAGIGSALVTTPGHVLVAFDTGLPQDARVAVAFDEQRGLIHRGRVWIPLESTVLQKGFAAAWEAGAREIARHDPGDVHVIEIRRAWKEYPPVSLATRRSAPTLDSELVRKRWRGSVEAVKKLGQRRLAAAMREERELGDQADVGSQNEIGVRLAQLGALDAARARFEKAHLVAPDDRRLSANLATTRFHAGDIDAAISGYSALLETPGPHQSAVRRNLALAHFARGAQGDRERAAELLAEGGVGVLRSLAQVVSGTDELAGEGDQREQDALQRELEVLLRNVAEKIREKRGVELTPEKQRARLVYQAGRRGVDPTRQTRITDLLAWLK